MRFDSNQAWKDATEAVAANRDMLLALGGVFMMLPTFAIMVFFPMPELPSDLERLSAAMGEYLQGAFPWLALARLLQLTGLSAMIALMTDPARPTVSQAIITGARLAAIALVAMVSVTLLVIFAALLPVELLTALGKRAQLLVGIPAGLAILLYGSARSLPILPVIVAERQRNPFAAIGGGWAVSRGNGWRLAVFLMLLMLAFTIVSWLFLNGLNILLRLVAGEGGSKMALSLAASSVNAIADIYTAALMAALYRQLKPPAGNQMMDKAG